jgi:hypothetical protein
MEERKIGYFDSKSKDGGLSAHISRETAERVKPYCKAHNLNCKHFIEDCINARMDDLEKEELIQKPKEEIIDLYLKLIERYKK